MSGFPDVESLIVEFIVLLQLLLFVDLAALKSSSSVVMGDGSMTIQR